MAKQKGMSFKAVAESRNESAVLALTRSANLYYQVAQQRVQEARKQLSRCNPAAHFRPQYPGMSIHAAVAQALKPPEFFTATEVGS